MRKTLILAIILVAVVVAAGCQSKDSGTGYSTYSGQSGGDVGGGGCGRFASSAADECAEPEADGVLSL